MCIVHLASARRRGPPLGVAVRAWPPSGRGRQGVAPLWASGAAPLALAVGRGALRAPEDHQSAFEATHSAAFSCCTLNAVNANQAGLRVLSAGA